MKLAYANGYESGRPAFGFSLSVFEKQEGPYLKDESVKYYLIKPGISMGIRLGRFDIGGAFHYQSETNKSFKEGKNDEFRRHYQLELYSILKLNSWWNLHLESAYREPYNKKIDVNVRFWHILPGISFILNEKHNIGLSLLVPLLKEGYADRGAQIRYCFSF
jgi:hypothetical protein